MVQMNALQHIGILVPDVYMAEKWYVEKSGFVKKAEFETEGNKVVFVWHEESGVLCELIQRPEGSAEAIEIKKLGAKIDHIAYEVNDIYAEFEHAQMCEMDIIEGIVDIPTFWNNGFQYFLVASPGGAKVEYCKVL